MAGITHAFTSAKADGSDSSLVKPSDWNAAHVIGDGSMTLDAASNVGTFTVNGLIAVSLTTAEAQFGVHAVPSTSDAHGLGTASLMWSDLFLASGGVINWNNGDVTATHSANALAFAGAANGYSFDNVISQSFTPGSSGANLDISGQSGIVINNGASAQVTPSGQGMLCLILNTTSTSYVYAFATGGGVSLVSTLTQGPNWATATTAPTAGFQSFAFDPGTGSYRVFNNTGGTCTYRVHVIKPSN